MKSRYTVQDAYRARITADVSPISISGDPLTEFSIPVDIVPVDTEWRLVLNFNQSTKKDKIYFHRVSGSTLYYYRKNRGNPTVLHEENDYIQMNNFSEWFNYGFDNIDDFWLILDMWTNKAQILWWLVDAWTGVVDVASTAITALADWTHYAVFDYLYWILKFVTTYDITIHYLVWQIIITGWIITSKSDKRYVDLLKNKSVVNDLWDSGWNLTYKWLPIWSWSWTDKRTVISETLWIRVANFGEYIICKNITIDTAINLPLSETANKWWRLCVKKWTSKKKVVIVPFAWGSIDWFGISLWIQNINTTVTLVSNWDWTRSIE